MSPNTAALIARRLAAPKSFRVLTKFADGAIREHKTETLGQANTYADFVERPRIGKDLIDRATGATVRVTSVEIEAL